MNFINILKRPSAFLPVSMSFIALITVIIHILIFGIVSEADEGAAAHIFQLLIVAEIPIIIFFAFKWLPRTPRQALQVLLLQISSVLAALAPVFFLKL
ncbi:MAG: hypothetical protein WBV81_04810 [Ignavibacteriaceae bacterium]